MMVNREQVNPLGPRSSTRTARLARLGRPRGMSLLEVLLSLIVLVTALSGIAALVTLGSGSGADARELTVGQLLCESKMSEIAAGIVPPGGGQGTFEWEEDWVFNIESTPTETPGLLNIRVTVSQDPGRFENPLFVELVRWMPDPDFAAGVAQ